MLQPNSFIQGSSRLGERPEDPLSPGLNDHQSTTNHGEILTEASTSENDRQPGDLQPSDPSRTFAGGQPTSRFNQEFSPMYSPSSIPANAFNSDNHISDMPPSRPIFGLSLEDLLKRDGSAIPLVVYQCLQAIDLFGLEVEGVYRLSGSAAHITKLRTIFDNGKPALIQLGILKLSDSS